MNSSGRYNVFIGDKVGYSNTEGVSNVIIGSSAGSNITTGYGNLFVGSWSGINNTTGAQNVYLGNKAGLSNSEGKGNVFIGSYSGLNEYGSNKLYIENSSVDSTQALIWGDFSSNLLRVNGKLGINTQPQYYELEIGDTNGVAVMMVKGTGDLLYSYSRVVLMSDEISDKRWDILHNISNNFELSYNDGNTWYNDLLEVNNDGDLTTGGSVIPFNNNLDSLGTSSNRWNVVYATNDVINTSDKRLKTNINDLNYGLEQILKLHPVSFNWKDKPLEQKKLGLIAQEVQPIINEVVDVGNDQEQTLGITYSAFVPV